MKVKTIAKGLLGWWRCLVAGVMHNENVYIGHRVHFVNGRNILLGNGVQIRPYCDLFAGTIKIGDNCDIGTRNRIVGNVILENDVLLGPDNYVSSHDHEYRNIEVPVMYQGICVPGQKKHQEIVIGEGSWIGTHTAILGTVHIGKHCVIGANAVVIRDVPDYSVVVGIPGRVVKQYDLTEKRWRKIENR